MSGSNLANDFNTLPSNRFFSIVTDELITEDIAIFKYFQDSISSGIDCRSYDKNMNSLHGHNFNIRELKFRSQ